MTNDTYNIILDNQVFTYSINNRSNQLHNNSEFINIYPEIECKYDHCNSHDSKYNQYLSINAHSVIHNIDDVILLLDSIETKFSIIDNTETWPQNHNADIFTINNYKTIHTTRMITKGCCVNYCRPMITRPTLYSDNLNSLIVNILCNVTLNPIHNNIIISDVSDHFPICIIYDVNYATNK